MSGRFPGYIRGSRASCPWSIWDLSSRGIRTYSLWMGRREGGEGVSEMRQGPYCQELLASLKSRVENIFGQMFDGNPKGLWDMLGVGPGQSVQGQVLSLVSRDLEECWSRHRWEEYVSGS